MLGGQGRAWVRGSEGEGVKRRPNTANLNWRQNQGSINFCEQVYLVMVWLLELVERVESVIITNK